MTFAANASRLMGFPTGPENINPFAGFPDTRRCESSRRASCAIDRLAPPILCRLPERQEKSRICLRKHWPTSTLDEENPKWLA